MFVSTFKSGVSELLGVVRGMLSGCSQGSHFFRGVWDLLIVFVLDDTDGFRPWLHLAYKKIQGRIRLHAIQEFR